MNQNLKIPLIVALATMLLATLAIGGAFWLRSETFADREAEVCQAIKDNNRITRKLVTRTERRLLISIEEGRVDNLEAAEVRAFYDPIIAEIDAVNC